MYLSVKNWVSGMLKPGPTFEKCNSNRTSLLQFVHLAGTGVAPSTLVNLCPMIHMAPGYTRPRTEYKSTSCLYFGIGIRFEILGNWRSRAKSPKPQAPSPLTICSVHFSRPPEAIPGDGAPAVFPTGQTHHLPGRSKPRDDSDRREWPPPGQGPVGTLRYAFVMANIRPANPPG